MTLLKRIFNISLISAFTLSVGINQSAQAADLNIPDVPIFVGSSIQPNIMLAVDDSGSMDWEVLVSNEAQAEHQNDNFFRNGGTLFLPPHTVRLAAMSRQGMIVPPEDLNDLTEREICSKYNVLAYDPNITYTPWIGEDEQGNTYSDMSLTQARLNPYDPDEGIEDLTTDGGYYYYVWRDLNNNGVYDRGECPTPARVFIAPPDDGRNDPALAAAGAAGHDQIIYVRANSAEATNYANWFSYYRKREYVLKRVMSEIITNNTNRLGLATLHNNSQDEQGVGTAIRDMTNDTNKQNLLRQMFRIESRFDTPLRRLLDNVGRYYDDTDNQQSPQALGFTESSPILPANRGGECQQNYTVLMSDGFWNGDFTGLGNIDINTATTQVDTDNDDTTPRVPVQFAGGPHADDSSNTLADIAMFYYMRDLSTLANEVVVLPGIDDNDQQHMVTFGVAFGVQGTLPAPPAGTNIPANHNPATLPPLGPVATTGGWPSPSDNADETIDDLRHAAFNGRGEFLSAGDPQELITSLLEAIEEIGSRNTFSGTSVAVNSAILRTDSLVFTAGFDSQDYSGSLRAFEIDQDGNILDTVTDPNTGQTTQINFWEASQIGRLQRGNNGTTGQITARDNIFTIVNKSGIDTPIPFNTSDTDLILATSGPVIPPALLPSVSGFNVINYIAGDATFEQNGTFRRRENTLLGDIVSSSPFVAGPDDFNFEALPGAEGADYLPFLNTKRQRFATSGNPNSLILVGANDGMLHAFRARRGDGTASGAEVFGYVPKTVHENLHLLTDPNYGHRFYVNAPGFASDAYINGNWQTLYTSALGEGGRGVFMLDITNPFNASNNNNPAVWERNSTDTGYEQMGFIKHAPGIVRLNNGRWGVIFGNGYNGGSGNPTENNEAQLFILDAADGSIIRRFDTNTGGTGVNLGLRGNANGMAEPLIVDIDGNRTADIIYVGDLLGNLWKIDISGTSENSWEFSFGSATNPEPFYQATENDETTRQAITSKPGIASHPDGGFIVLFGTGKFLEADDNLLLPPIQENTFYGLRDTLNNTNLGIGRTGQNSPNLTEQTIDVLIASNGNEGRVTSSNFTPGTPTDGWFLDFNQQQFIGERIISNPVVRFGNVLFNTFIPTSTPCEFGGSSFIMGIDAISGNQTQGSIFDFNNDGTVDSSDRLGANNLIGSGIRIDQGGTIGGLGIVLTQGGQDKILTSELDGGGIGDTVTAGGDLILGRTSWRQIQ